MNVMIACRAGAQGQGARLCAALRDALRVRGMRVFIDHYDDAALAANPELKRRADAALRQADALILAVDDAHAVAGSRQERLFQTFQRLKKAGLFAVYAAKYVSIDDLPRALQDRMFVSDAPGAAERLAMRLSQYEARITPPAPQKPQKRKGRGAKTVLIVGAVLTTLIVSALVFILPLGDRPEEPVATPTPVQSEDAALEDMQRTMRVTIIEGTKLEDMASQLEEKITAEGGTFSAARFLELCKTGTGYEVYPFVADALAGENAASRNYALEGYLFPDTYEIFVHTSEEAVIDKMLTRFSEIVSREEFSAALSQSGMSLDDAVTLASVIQKEGTSESFSKISAVFHNRLSAGMPLQSDVTAQYASGKSALTMTQEDVSIDSPYNTYRVTGLPVGPICSPGEAALLAAVTPDADYVAEGYLYFLLTDPATGVIAYSRTYAEHAALAEQYAPLWAQHDARQ